MYEDGCCICGTYTPEGNDLCPNCLKANIEPNQIKPKIKKNNFKWKLSLYLFALLGIWFFVVDSLIQ